jgi:hypothetical protein
MVCNANPTASSILVTKDRHGKPLNRFELFLAMLYGREVSLKDTRGNVIKGRIKTLGVSDNSAAHLDMQLQTRNRHESVLALTDAGDGLDDSEYP